MIFLTSESNTYASPSAHLKFNPKKYAETSTFFETALPARNMLWLFVERVADELIALRLVLVLREQALIEERLKFLDLVG